jgi:hypothetical protein
MTSKRLAPRRSATTSPIQRKPGQIWDKVREDGRRASDARDSLTRMPFLPRLSSGQDQMAEAFESRRTDNEAAAIAAERIRSGAADQKEDGAAALAKLGIMLPKKGG